MQRPTRLAIAATLVAIVLRTIVLFDVQDAPFWRVAMVDEEGYLGLAEAMARGAAPAQGAYYIAPGYIYFLSAFLKIGVLDIASIKVFQLLVGVANSLLLFTLTRRLFGAVAGFVAATLWSLLPTVLFHEILLLKPTLTVFFVLLALLAIVGLHRSPWRWAAAGAGIGAAALFRGEMGAVALLLVLAGLVADGARVRQLPKSWAALFGLAAFLAVVAIPTIENVRRGGGLVVVAYGSGSNFYIGNNPDADGSYRPLRLDRSDPIFEEEDAVRIASRASGRPLRPAEVSRYWFGQGLKWWGSDPVAALALTAKKATLLWSWWEGSDVLSTKLASRWVWLLGNRLVVPGILMPIALMGLWLSRRRRELWPLWLFLIGSQLALAPFFIFERFRLPMIACAMPFVAHASTQAFYRWRLRKGQVALAVLVCGLLSAALSLPSIERDEAILGVNIGGMYMKQGRFEEALAEFLEVRRATPSAQRIEINIANAYHFMGREREALESLERAIRYLYEEGRRRGGVSAEELSYCHELSGDILRDQDATRQAREHYTAALRLAPGNARLQRKMAEL